MSAVPRIGGQAVIEGVMMRHEDRLAIAVRTPDTGIVVHEEKLVTWGQRFPVLKLPLLRGVVAFLEALVLGTRALTISANLAMPEEEEELNGWQLTLTVGAALVFTIALFFFLPTFLLRLLHGVLPARPLLLNLLEGAVRIAIFLLYLVLISRMQDIRRVFAYHGAEHKVIACFEAGKELTPENAEGFTTLHPRCGTSFLLLVMAISILLFTFFGWPTLWLRLLLRVLLLPLVAGISYEIIRLAGRYRFFCYLTAPGLWLQRLTTREPEHGQLEVAIKAVQAVLAGAGESEV
ncbi:MAG TPA: DUF1385 domain-containing protein [Firmicutes bacterium]|nr:DUF1385 domain-containing protein [Bacillota bacterium]